MTEELILKLADYGTAVLALVTLIFLIKMLDKKSKNSSSDDMLYLKISGDLAKAVIELKEAIIELKSCIEMQKHNQDMIMKEIIHIRNLSEKIWNKETSQSK